MSPVVRACGHAGCSATLGTGTHCRKHPRAVTTTQRGYGWSWQKRRAKASIGAKCELCGSTKKLQRDHLRPRSLGGDDSDANLRWLCASCHTRHGVRENRNRGWRGGSKLR